MYDIEKYDQAVDVADAIRALENDPDAVVISGGSDVLIKIREGKLAGCSLVSIHGIKELEGVSLEPDGTIVIGPCTTFSHIANNEIIRRYVPMLGDAVDQAGGPQLRNIGTIGGNVCNGVTSADSASSLCCLNAILVLQGPEGVREVPISAWYARAGTHGEKSQRGAHGHPDPQRGLRGLWRPLHQIRQTKRHGDRNPGLRGIREAGGGQTACGRPAPGIRGGCPDTHPLR